MFQGKSITYSLFENEWNFNLKELVFCVFEMVFCIKATRLFQCIQSDQTYSQITFQHCNWAFAKKILQSWNLRQPSHLFEYRTARVGTLCETLKCTQLGCFGSNLEYLLQNFEQILLNQLYACDAETLNWLRILFGRRLLIETTLLSLRSASLLL